jgi:hypothetical protein
MSSKSESKYIGHKGQGTKLLLYCNQILMVVSRSAGDDEGWGCWFQEKPVETMLQKNSNPAPTIEIERLSSIEAKKRIKDELGVLNNVAADETRWKIYLMSQIDKFLQGPSGTLVIELGIQDDSLKELLDGLDKFTTLDLNTDINRITSDPKHPDNKIFLLWFMRLKTIIGHPLYDESLGDFDEAMRNEESRIKMLVNKDQIPSLKVLTSGENREAFAWRDIGIGFPYPKMKVRQKDNANADPETTRDWKNAVFQARYLRTFMVGMNKFTVVLSVDGSHARHGHFTMLNRRGKPFLPLNMHNHAQSIALY